MNNPAKIAIASVAVVATVAAVAKTSHDYNQDLYERFPDVDRKIVRRAYRRMMTKAFTGQYETDMQHWNDEVMDTLFRVEVFNLLARQK